MKQDEYLSYDGTGLAQLVEKKQVQASELLDLALERVVILNPAINAVVKLMEEEARDAVNPGPPVGLFTGVPFLAKDLGSHYKGHPTSAGSRLTSSMVSKSDTDLVRRLRATGVSILGKTNVPEFGLTPYTESVLWGACKNPWDLTRTPGGASGGSAAAVSAACAAT